MPMTFDAGQFYDEFELIAAGQFTSSQLKKARLSGLRYKQFSRGHRVYKGEWLLEWIETKPEVQNAEVPGAEKRGQAVRPRPHP